MSCHATGRFLLFRSLLLLDRGLLSPVLRGNRAIHRWEFRARSDRRKHVGGVQRTIAHVVREQVYTTVRGKHRLGASRNRDLTGIAGWLRVLVNIVAVACAISPGVDRWLVGVVGRIGFHAADHVDMGWSRRQAVQGRRVEGRHDGGVDGAGRRERCRR